MKVKVGDKIYDGEKEPVMVIMTEKERKSLVKNFINSAASKYCVYPATDYWNNDNFKNIKEWMEI